MKKSLLFIFFLGAAFFSIRGFLYTPYYFSIPIEFKPYSHLPVTSIEIEGKNHKVEIDLGARMPLSLRETILKDLIKKPNGTSRRVDIWGNEYETPLFHIPKAKTGDFTVKKIETREESYDFATKNSTVYDDTDRTEEERCQYTGRIGRGFFSGKNIFMDFHNSIFILCKDLKDLGRDGYKFENLTSAPFEITLSGILLKTETDIGITRFVIDTGSTISILRSSLTAPNLETKRYGLSVFSSVKFSFNGIDLGPQDFCLLEISPVFKEMDGLLGMDFLQEHIIYLDFKTNTAYIGKSPDKPHTLNQ